MIPDELTPLDPWAEQAIQTALEERIPFHVAVNTHGFMPTAMTPEQGAAYQRRKAFREAWTRQEREFYKAQSNPIVHDKSILIGRLNHIAEGLEKKGELKAGADVRVQVAKIEGWTGPESTIHIYEKLSGADFERWKQDIAERRSQQKVKPN